MCRRSIETILQIKHTDGQKTHEKMFNITHYQRNANQNYNEVPPYTGQVGHHQKNLQIINAGEGAEKGKLHSFLQYWWEYKLPQPLWKTVWRCLKKLKIELSYDPAILLLSTYLEKNII